MVRQRRLLGVCRLGGAFQCGELKVKDRYRPAVKSAAKGGTAAVGRILPRFLVRL